MAKRNQSIRCSFCGKPQESVHRIVAGPGVYICDECIKVCNNILETDEYEDDEEEEQYDDWGLEEKPVGDVIKEKIGGWGFVKRLFGRGMEAPQDDILREQRNVDCRKKY